MSALNAFNSLYILNILLKFEQNNEATLLRIQDIINNNPGDLYLLLHLESNVGTTKQIKIKKKKISSSYEFLRSLRDEFGYSNIWLN